MVNVCGVAATFRQYDYGVIENFARYGSTAPPNYNVSLITAPVASYYASNDLLASVEVSIICNIKYYSYTGYSLDCNKYKFKKL